MTVLLALPVLLPLLGAALSLVLGRRPDLQRVIGLTVLSVVVVIASVLVYTTDTRGPVVAQLGGYAAPFGITLVADRLAALLLLVSAVVTLAVLVFSIGQRVTDYGREIASTTFQPAYLVLCAGVSLAYITGDLFNLFVAFEIMLSASYVLITRRTTARRVRAGMTYVIVSLTSSLLFITLIALVYAAAGTINLADLSVAFRDLSPGVQTSIALLATVVFGIKAALVPLHFWLPDSYPTAPAPITAVFAGLLTKVGVYALIRTHTLVFQNDTGWTVILVVSMLTMIVGALGAIAQEDINRLLSFLLVSHIGFMLFGLGMATVVGVTGAILYVVHHITVQAALFLVSGLLTRRTGTVSLREMSGVARTAPFIAVLFAVPALNLAGIPPFSGFIAKITLFRAGAESATALVYTATAAAVLTSFLTLYALTRVWVGAFWGAEREPFPNADPTDEVTVGTGLTSRPMVFATSVLVLAGVAIALAAGPLSAMSERAAEDLLGGDQYRGVVLTGAED
ncbi:Na+/H+ antiporter subunit D [Saccharomonospora xinjiangensis]|uniref:Formate hydrogenlyase subunit 3/multisubunit Na+/H+ antiporter, MnhD subunit n=1 Tax=Saccharomonospora xinjiangensis XJ-54 TaxID=882086 RepID=I0UXQ3_9PSEU|nr:Na+/H+ antiporter subunit D [Saccharomonospora xinjiangensis]EID52656.1 formate hydrogenlyase subunit 3/multisubunit Na+/H+ antiporter, MnhD subunit [Saccharomonospora xinjiangensis XJ-54]